MTSSSASIAGGVLDSVSAGILLYAATVELMVRYLLHLFHLHMLNGIGPRIRFQPILPYLFLEKVDICHYLFRTRYRLDVFIG
jgi:hypothetical protein